MPRQHPCSVCGKELASDDMYDVIVSKREPRTDRTSKRSTCKRYLPPNRTTIAHLYLCEEHGANFLQFVSLYEKGGN